MSSGVICIVSTGPAACQVRCGLGGRIKRLLAPELCLSVSELSLSVSELSLLVPELGLEVIELGLAKELLYSPSNK